MEFSRNLPESWIVSGKDNTAEFDQPDGCYRRAASNQGIPTEGDGMFKSGASESRVG